MIWFVRMTKGASVLLLLASRLFAEDRLFDSAGVRIRQDAPKLNDSVVRVATLGMMRRPEFLAAQRKRIR